MIQTVSDTGYRHRATTPEQRKSDLIRRAKLARENAARLRATADDLDAEADALERRANDVL